MPLAAAAIRRAIELNGAAVDMNIDAFDWGRRAAAEPRRVARAGDAGEEPTDSRHLSQTLDEIDRAPIAFLTDYQDAAYAAATAPGSRACARPRPRSAPGSTALAEAVARYLFKLMAYKDEYEVARLYTNGAFREAGRRDLRGREPALRVPPRAAAARPRQDPATGVPRKMSFGPWMMQAFRVLAKLKGLRGTPLDIFGYTHERKAERRLIRDYEALLGEIVASSPRRTTRRGRARACRKKIRGFGHIKARNLETAKGRRPSFSPVSVAPSPRWRSPLSNRVKKAHSPFAGSPPAAANEIVNAPSSPFAAPQRLRYNGYATVGM